MVDKKKGAPPSDPYPLSFQLSTMETLYVRLLPKEDWAVHFANSSRNDSSRDSAKGLGVDDNPEEDQQALMEVSKSISQY